MKKRFFLLFLLLSIAVFITSFKNESKSDSSGSETIGTEAKQAASIQSSVSKDGSSSEDTSTLKKYPNMVRIPAGSFEMGDHFNEGVNAEKPVHTVNISEFWMDKYEVTNGEYKKCVDAGVCSAPYDTESFSRSSYYGDSRYVDYPVINISWDDARKYCEWKGGRLPTEAEWEYAARGGLRGARYPNGDSIDCGNANYSRFSYTDYNGPCCGLGGRDNDTHQVGSYTANGYGLYDMAGNVWEWCYDWYDENYYSKGSSIDPKGPSSGKYRVLRGGSWVYITRYIRVAHRNFSNPTYSYGDVGFRCVR